MFHDFRFGLSIFTTHLTYICLKFPFHIEMTVTELSLCSGNSVNVIFHVEKTFKAYVCQMCGKYAKTESEIMKHYQKEHIIFFILNLRSWDFKTLLEKANPTSIDSFLDNPNFLIRNVSAQPLEYLF